MSWACTSCGWVNRGHQKCEECQTPAGAPARNVAYVVEKTQGSPSHGVRQQERVRVQTFPNGLPWA